MEFWNELLNMLLTSLVGIVVLIWAIRLRHATARWKRCGRRVFWFSVLFLIGGSFVELLAMLGVPSVLQDRVGFLMAFCLSIGLIEEGTKLAAVLCGTSGLRNVTSPADLISYGLVSASAFTIVENVLYAFSQSFSLDVCFTRAIVSTPMHLACSIIVTLGLVRFAQTQKTRYALLYYLLGAVVHGLFDAIVMLYGEEGTAIVVFCIGMAPAAWAILIFALRAPKQYAKQHRQFVCPHCNASSDQAGACPNCGKQGLVELLWLPQMR